MKPRTLQRLVEHLCSKAEGESLLRPEIVMRNQAAIREGGEIPHKPGEVIQALSPEERELLRTATDTNFGGFRPLAQRKKGNI